MSPRCQASLIVAMLGVTFPLSAQESPDTTRFIGCYTLHEASWDPPFEQAGDQLPDTLRLLGERGAEFPEEGRLLVRPQLSWGDYRIAVWHTMAVDSVTIQWSDGFFGYLLRLGFDGPKASG